jgi:hypothetical protein
MPAPAQETGAGYLFREEKLMKFLCNTEFVHSGVRSYTPGAVFDFTAEYAEKLIALDAKKPLGALAFFTPVGEDTVNFLKTVKRNPVSGKSKTPTGDAGKETGTVTRQRTRMELIAEAKGLGIKGADRMSVEELTEVIDAKKGEGGQQTTAPATSETTTPTGDAGKETGASR